MASQEDSSLPPIKNEWPGGFGIYKYSKQALKLNIKTIASLVGIVAAYIILINIIDLTISSSFRPLISLFNWLFSSFVDVALVRTSLATIKGKKMSLDESYQFSGALYLQVLILQILTGLSIAVSFILFIIPGLFVLPRLALAPYFLIGKKLSAVDAYKASWNSTKGHTGKIYGVIGVGILIFLPVITVIGIPLTIYLLIMYALAPAFLYRFIIDNPVAEAA